MSGKHFGKTYNAILEKISQKKGLIFLVLDPPNQSPAKAGELAKIAEKAGVAAIAVGGSIGAQGLLLEQTILSIKKSSKLPVILFPGNIATLNEHADAVYFMSMLNSLDPYYLSGAQIASSIPVKKMGLEVIPTSYIIVEPGMAVGHVGRAKCIPRDIPYLAGATALAGEYMGSHFVILEAGGGSPKHVPKELVAAARKLVSVPIIVAGGVKTEKQVAELIDAGADIIHVGAAIEQTNDNANQVEKLLSAMVKAAEKAGKQRK
ncbi:MAG: geranylgeranylglyceryl/heptaprenylglyceryl phosphate synthase [Candidatus Diapherotrites archaeon]|nr:geranylgeranylglyceryl/heptaprenylglyceryl phosphate synthase [Candidatus Diapherotrites archaeon]